MIRPATRSDRAAVAVLWQAFVDEQAALDARVAPAPDAAALWDVTFRDLVDDASGVLLVAENGGGEIVGFAVAEPHAEAPMYERVPEMHIGELYVHPSARRQGLALALLDAVAAHAAARGAERVRFSVLWANVASRRMVEAWGAEPHAVAFTKPLR